MDGVKLASLHTVTTSEATKAAARLAGTCGVHGCTGVESIILSNAGTVLARAVTSYYSHHRVGIGHSHAEQVGHLRHYLLSAYGAEQSLQ